MPVLKRASGGLWGEGWEADEAVGEEKLCSCGVSQTDAADAYRGMVGNWGPLLGLRCTVTPNAQTFQRLKIPRLSGSTIEELGNGLMGCSLRARLTELPGQALSLQRGVEGICRGSLFS